MKTVTLGSTGITTPQNAFGALPVQRDDMETSIKILRRAFEGGMTFFDTARAYSDSEEKLGNALSFCPLHFSFSLTISSTDQVLLHAHFQLHD